jgi:hypothetical protein
MANRRDMDVIEPFLAREFPQAASRCKKPPAFAGAGPALLALLRAAGGAVRYNVNYWTT